MVLMCVCLVLIISYCYWRLYALERVPIMIRYNVSNKDNPYNYPFQLWEELRIEWLQLGTSFLSRWCTTNGVFFHKIVNRIDTSLSLYVIIICQKTRISNFSNRKYIWRRQSKHQSYYWTLPRMNISYVINSVIQKPMHIVSNHLTSLLPFIALISPAFTT